ncbi:hypothetical protein ATK36_5013 [Amycolatopsis sulphurea]|uniref:Uncharacterized protein n=1 Tax=Amycolatopsis sulphurea TaxID=76022 RepID=A0A2A9FF87_9PSEU|nr:hypothetical protein [Amycolatopsis sulphurea]PFG49828.1 hypothetical protein ATK36_5013 [Amycolatopsis sulphurea]
MNRDEHVDLAGYLTGLFGTDEHRAAEAHLECCPACRSEAASLREVRGILGELPPEALLVGAPEDGDLLLKRTVHRVRTESRRRTGRGTLAAAAAAVVVAAIGLGIGVAVGSSNSPTAVSPPTIEAPGIRTVHGASGDASLTATIAPAAGWVRVNAMVTGLPSGEKCLLVVEDKNGERQIAGGWVVTAESARDGASLYGSAIVDPAQVAAISIENTAGHRFVRAGLP